MYTHIYDDTMIIVCIYAHTCKRKENLDGIVEDLGCMHRCTEPRIKDALLELFAKKWDAEGETEFVNYFSTQWVLRNSRVFIFLDFFGTQVG